MHLAYVLICLAAQCCRDLILILSKATTARIQCAFALIAVASALLGYSTAGDEVLSGVTPHEADVNSMRPAKRISSPFAGVTTVRA